MIVSAGSATEGVAGYRHHCFFSRLSNLYARLICVYFNRRIPKCLKLICIRAFLPLARASGGDAYFGVPWSLPCVPYTLTSRFYVRPGYRVEYDDVEVPGNRGRSINSGSLLLYNVRLGYLEQRGAKDIVLDRF